MLSSNGKEKKEYACECDHVRNRNKTRVATDDAKQVFIVPIDLHQLCQVSVLHRTDMFGVDHYRNKSRVEG